MEWNSAEGCLHTKHFVKNSITIELLNMKIDDVRNGMLTGHCKQIDYLVKVGIRNNPDCDLRNRAQESVKLTLCDCIALSYIRQITFAIHTLNPQK